MCAAFLVLEAAHNPWVSSRRGLLGAFNFSGPSASIIVWKALTELHPCGGLIVPKFDESEAKGRAGVHEVGLAISRMKWIFRDQPVSDTRTREHAHIVEVVTLTQRDS